MTVSKLLEGLRVKKKQGPMDTAIKGIAYDSRLVEDGFLFVAVRGFSVDGHDYIKDAVSRGAVAVVAEDAVEITKAGQIPVQDRTAFIQVSESREALALISAAFYKHPSRRLSLTGITGTNGKTTTSFIVKSIINAGGDNAGLLGTINYMTGERTEKARNTTPESLDLQRYLNEMVYNGIKYAVLEVSSHALSLKRINGCSFKVAAFTNFSQDHLDFHGTMEEYFRAKRRLFDYLGPEGVVVLNRDDPMIRPLAHELNCNVITCGIEKGATLRAENIAEQSAQRTGRGPAVPSGLSFDVRTSKSRFRVESGFIGLFNVYNILVSIGIAHALGYSEDVIQRGVRDAGVVEGRFESIDEGQDFLCIVDYAHTEDALKKLIQTARRVTKGKVITVFGCGGDRDRTKRPLMGAVASGLSDTVVVTSDNPRSEGPADIIKDIVQGIKKKNFTLRTEREEAIMEAVSIAGEGDTVLVAGKGHEDYQEMGGARHHFSDKEVLRKAIREKRKSDGFKGR